MDNDDTLQIEVADFIRMLKKVGPYHESLRAYVQARADIPEFPELAATMILMHREADKKDIFSYATDEDKYPVTIAPRPTGIRASLRRGLSVGVYYLSYVFMLPGLLLVSLGEWLEP